MVNREHDVSSSVDGVEEMKEDPGRETFGSGGEKKQVVCGLWDNWCLESLLGWLWTLWGPRKLVPIVLNGQRAFCGATTSVSISLFVCFHQYLPLSLLIGWFVYTNTFPSLYWLVGLFTPIPSPLSIGWLVCLHQYLPLSLLVGWFVYTNTFPSLYWLVGLFTPSPFPALSFDITDFVRLVMAIFGSTL